MIRKSVTLAITFAILVLSHVSRAQDQQPTQQPSIDSVIEVFRANMRADRATIITENMNFTDKDGAAFWPVYREYEYERTKVDDCRAALIKEYATKYSTLNDADAKGMAERLFDCDSRLVELKKVYFNKFNKVLPSLTVAKFFQLERRIDLVMYMKVESALPPLMQPRPVEKEN